MSANLRLAITADLHWGTHDNGDDATGLLLEFLRQQPPDVLILAGDIGAGDHFAECLALFDDLSCRKALVPGNHDIWVTDNDPRGDSLQVYQEYLPKISGEHGFHYLEHGPLVFQEADLALVGSINWYDYSWSLEQLKTRIHDWERRLRTKLFSRGRHNDGRFVRWALNDEEFTTLVFEAGVDSNGKCGAHSICLLRPYPSRSREHIGQHSRLQHRRGLSFQEALDAGLACRGHVGLCFR